jgi:hypothetical protein
MALSLLSEAEILILPKNAQIAFAARCARRVQGILNRWWPIMNDRQKEIIDEMITIAENCTCDPSAALAYNTSPFLAFARGERNVVKATAYAAIYSAFRAVITRSTTYVLQTMDFTVLAHRIELTNKPESLKEIMRDYRKLLNKTQAEDWINHLEVRPNVFGSTLEFEEEASWIPETPRFFAARGLSKVQR